MKDLTPFGVQDLLPEEQSAYEQLTAAFQSIFEKNNYKKVKTPTIEYYDTLEPGLGEHLKEKSIKFFDTTGHCLVLRPDHTTPIARLVATQMQNEAKPLRLAYIDPVFSKVDPLHIEQFQAGIELIGEKSAKADAEIITTCIDALLEIGLKDLMIDIGHTHLVDNHDPEKKEALLKGDYIAYGHIPERGDSQLAKGYPDLEALYSELEKQGYAQYIHINKGLVKDIQYYTGMIFECCVPEAKKPIASGGRYNQLLSRFGYDCPAVGFAANLSEIQKVMP